MWKMLSRAWRKVHPFIPHCWQALAKVCTLWLHITQLHTSLKLTTLVKHYQCLLSRSNTLWPNTHEVTLCHNRCRCNAVTSFVIQSCLHRSCCHQLDYHFVPRQPTVVHNKLPCVCCPPELVCVESIFSDVFLEHTTMEQANHYAHYAANLTSGGSALPEHKPLVCRPA